MLSKDPIRIAGPLGRIYSFTRHYKGNDFFEGPRLAFHHDRAYARDHLLRLTQWVADDPFNYRLLDVWQLVFQKPWTRPRNVNQLIADLTDKIHRGELFVYLEPDLDRDLSSLIKDGPVEGERDLLAFIEQAQRDEPRVSGQAPVGATKSWGGDYLDGLIDTGSSIAADIADEQTELYSDTSGWGNVMYPVFKPVENFGRFIGNTVGLATWRSPNGLNPKVAEYWRGIGDNFRALGDKIVDAVAGDGRAAGEITPEIASFFVSKKLPDASPVSVTNHTRYLDKLKNLQQESYLGELSAKGIKHTPAEIVDIRRRPDGQLVFLEKGSAKGGLTHIIDRHGDHFAEVGINRDQIPDAVMTALTEGKVIGYQGKGTGRPIYDFVFNDTRQRMAVTVGDNGYIVGANPKGRPVPYQGD